MAVDDEPLDDKARRMRDLLSSFYSKDPSSNSMAATNPTSRFATLDTINTPSFDADHYMNLLVQKSNLEGLLQKHVEMAAEIKNLDTDLQMLVYENYNKFISATDTMKRMNNNIVGMETNMEQLLEKIMSVQSRSDGVNTSLLEKREHIEKLHRTRNLLRKVQFIYDLPSRLRKFIKAEAYADAVKFYIGAMPIFKAYGDSSFLDCKRSSEEAVAIITKNLQGKVFSDSESIQARAEAVMLLKQLKFPVENLKVKLFEKLEQFLVNLHLESKEITPVSADIHDSSNHGNSPDHVSAAAHEASIREFAEAIRAYRVIFPDSEEKLFGLARDLVRNHFEAVNRHIKKQLYSADLSAMLRVIWSDVLTMGEVLPEAALSDFAFQAARDAVKLYVASSLDRLLLNISDALTRVEDRQKKGLEEEYSLQSVFEASKKTVIQGSMDALLSPTLVIFLTPLNCTSFQALLLLQDFRQLLEGNVDLLMKLRDFIIDWVQEGFQEFFRKLKNDFLLLSGKSTSGSQDAPLTEGIQGEKVLPGLVLMLAQLSIFIEQSAIPRITEEIATSFSGGGARGYEYGPAFIPAEICRTFRSAGEQFLHLYINTRTQKISVLLKKRFTTPNWVKHKEPREVHMFVDLLLQEFEAIRNEGKQILPQELNRKHRRTDSNGSTASSRSNQLRDDRQGRSTTQKARSQLLESHLAKLFKQKMEIFTKTEHTQESVLNTIVKLCLKSLQEFVRLQTFNRRGFQQIQLDMEFLRSTLKDAAEDQAAVDFLLDEVIVGGAERCLDPIPLDQHILDKLIQAKLAKISEQNPNS